MCYRLLRGSGVREERGSEVSCRLECGITVLDATDGRGAARRGEREVGVPAAVALPGLRSILWTWSYLSVGQRDFVAPG